MLLPLRGKNPDSPEPSARVTGVLRTPEWGSTFYFVLFWGFFPEWVYTFSLEKVGYHSGVLRTPE